MVFRFKKKNLEEWHKWFAWRPVFIDDSDSIWDFVWLETIWRRELIGEFDIYWLYSLKEPKD